MLVLPPLRGDFIHSCAFLTVVNSHQTQKKSFVFLSIGLPAKETDKITYPLSKRRID